MAAQSEASGSRAFVGGEPTQVCRARGGARRLFQRQSQKIPDRRGTLRQNICKFCSVCAS